MLDRHQRRGAGPRQAGQQQVDQPARQLRVAACAGDHLGQAAEHVDMRAGVSELHLLQILRAERLLLNRLRARRARR